MMKFGFSVKAASALLLTATMLTASLAWADPDDAPTPRKMPRTPVSREALATAARQAAPPRNVDGPATAVDTERLRIGDVDVRLFGIVPPQLSASYGPQARIALDRLTAGGNVTCGIRDRDRDGRLLATCRNAKGQDIAEEMLKRGLAVTARGSLRTTELSDTYLAAEQLAENQKTGLWSVATPSAAAPLSPAAAAEKAAADKTVADKDQADKSTMLANLIASATNAVRGDAKPADAKPEAAKPEPVAPFVVIPAPVTKQDAKAVKAETPKAEKPAEAAAVIAPLPPVIANDNKPATPAVTEQPSFIERYQLLISGLLMLFTALGIIIALLAHRWLDRRDELRSIAAALRGELQAARAVCLGRLQTLAQEVDEGKAAWPRIRVLVFQAYVGRIGRLGAELARQIASIYGQASDYSAYYNATANSAEARYEPVSKQQALQTLVRHIEDVVPRLAQIETHGNLLAFGLKIGKAAPTISGPTHPRPGTSLPYVRTLGGNREESAHTIAHEQTAAASPARTRAEWEDHNEPHDTHEIYDTHDSHDAQDDRDIPVHAAPRSMNASLIAAGEDDEVSTSAVGPESESRAQHIDEPAAPEHIIQNQSEKHGAVPTETEKAAADDAVQAASENAGAMSAAKPAAKPEPKPDAFAAFAAATAAVAAEAAAIAAEEPKTEEAKAGDPVQSEIKPAPIAPRPLWGVLRKFATERLDRAKKEPAMEDMIPDYDTLTDDEIDAMNYDLDDDDDLTVKKAGIG